MNDRSLWDELRDLFETDDGSLPEIRVTYREGTVIAAGYALRLTMISEALQRMAGANTSRGRR